MNKIFLNSVMKSVCRAMQSTGATKQATNTGWITANIKVLTLL